MGREGEGEGRGGREGGGREGGGKECRGGAENVLSSGVCSNERSA